MYNYCAASMELSAFAWIIIHTHIVCNLTLREFYPILSSDTCRVFCAHMNITSLGHETSNGKEVYDGKTIEIKIIKIWFKD